MERDIIVVFTTMDWGMLVVNGKSGNSIEHGYDLYDAIPELFNKLEHSYSKPLVKEIYDEDYFSYQEVSALFKREEIDGAYFTQEELELLDKTEDIIQFVNKIKEHLAPYVTLVEQEEENEGYND